VSDERGALLEALDRHGASPLSFLLRYEGPWRGFAAGDAIVPYLEAPGAAVAWSDPLCAPAEAGSALATFAAAMRAQRRGVCAIAVSEATAQAVLAGGFSALKIGEEPRFDLASWRQPRGNRGKKLRWALNHARAEGVEIEQYHPADRRDERVDAEIEAVVDGWRARLGRAEPQSFMRTAPLAAAEHKRLFLARRQGRAEALLACAWLPAASGWYLEDIVRLPAAINGATELLVVEALRHLRDDGAASASFALAPMRRVGQQLDPRARWLGRLLGFAIRGFDRRYGFRAIARYEERFEPSDWLPRYIVFLPAFPRPATIRAAVRYLAA
jgi:lysylphosphatidylglycerol synthetase-like protein (DUF2156 family)